MIREEGAYTRYGSLGEVLASGARRRLTSAFMLAAFAIVLLAPAAAGAAGDDRRSEDSPWIRPAGPDAPLIWGRRDGIVVGLPSRGGLFGPRGLIRVGSVSPETGRPILINFIAFEPVVPAPGPSAEGRPPPPGRKGFSELEWSALDGVRGKRLWVEGPAEGTLAAEGGVETLRVAFACEPFESGARVGAEVRLRADRPEEAEFTVTAAAGSAPLAEATLTATMGNYGRMRRLHLARRTVSSLDLYRGYAGKDFVEKHPFPLAEMARSERGDAWAALTSDEADPASVPIPDKPLWQYRAPPLTQYWRVPREDIGPDLRVRVNGRRVYWASEREIPGGISFENFEVRQAYRPGQRFVFGLTRRPPEKIEPWRKGGEGDRDRTDRKRRRF
jgi:hypothetical protein